MKWPPILWLKLVAVCLSLAGSCQLNLVPSDRDNQAWLPRTWRKPTTQQVNRPFILCLIKCCLSSGRSRFPKPFKNYVLPGQRGFHLSSDYETAGHIKPHSKETSKKNQNFFIQTTINTICHSFSKSCSVAFTGCNALPVFQEQALATVCKHCLCPDASGLLAELL